MLRKSKLPLKLPYDESGNAELLIYLLALRNSGRGAAARQRVAAKAIIEKDYSRLRAVFSSIEPNLIRLAEDSLAEAAKMELQASIIGCAGYPSKLLHVSDPPLVVFSLGTGDLPKILDRAALTVAVVGARRFSSYGRRTAYKIGKELTENAAVVVSGLAMGIDGAAHSGALEVSLRSEGLYSAGVAVLGSGHRKLHPRCNAELAKNMMRSGGVVISEYEPSMNPSQFTFPARNRIIAGLVDAVIVVEAASRSGAAITARLAAQFGRDVWAVPGPIDSAVSEGANGLIADGAMIFTSCQDFLQHYRLTDPLYRDPEIHLTDTAEPGLEQLICAELASGEPCCFDELLVATAVASPQLREALHQLEQKGLVRSAAGGLYSSAAKSG